MSTRRATQPTLEAAYELLADSPNGTIAAAALPARIGRDPGELEWAQDLWALHQAACLEVSFQANGTALVRVTVKGRREGEVAQAARGCSEAPVLPARLTSEADPGSHSHAAPAEGRLATAIRDTGTTVLAKVVAELVCRAAGV